MTHLTQYIMVTYTDDTSYAIHYGNIHTDDTSYVIHYDIHR